MNAAGDVTHVSNILFSVQGPVFNAISDDTVVALRVLARAKYAPHGLS
jgi:hypothetical protein